MFNIADYVRHKTTGQIGQVFGYGHQMVNGVYLTTLTVRVASKTEVSSVIVEDVFSEWVGVEPKEIPEFLIQTQISPTVPGPTTSLELKDTVAELTGESDPISSDIFAVSQFERT